MILSTTSASLVALMLTAGQLPRDQFDDVMPPSHYIHSYPGVVQTLEVPVDALQIFCATAPRKRALPVAACSVAGDGQCTILIRPADDFVEPMRAAVLLHELAHCLGWPATHPKE